MTVIDHVVASIGPASVAHAEGARLNLAAAHTPILTTLGARMAGAQHDARPRAARRIIVVAAGDHGCGDPGLSLGSAHPTVVAASAILGGTAALAHVARVGGTPILVVDAGVREPAAMPATVVRLGGEPSRDLRHGPAMSMEQAIAGVEAGIALAVSLVDGGLDVLALGALGVGAEVVSLAVLTAATGHLPGGLGDLEAERVVRGLPAVAPGLPQLAAVGGPETALLCGLILGAASMNVPCILDGYATGAAAIVAVMLAPNTAGYLIAAHVGTFTQPAILRHLMITPVFEVGLGRGEGVGAAMILPYLDQVAEIVGRG